MTLVGRHPACDVVINNSAVSRRQLLIHARADAVELVKLGRQNVYCNESELGEQAMIAGDGDRISFGGTKFAVLRRFESERSTRWLICIDGGPGLEVRTNGLVIGGRGHEDLTVEGWPPDALRIHGLDSGVIVECSAAARRLLSEREQDHFDGDGFARIDPDRGLSVAGRMLSVLGTGSKLQASTLLSGHSTVVRLESYGRGGVLVIESGGGEPRSAYFSRLRFALVRALIHPRPPASPGDYLGVEALCEEIWPDSEHKTEYDFNVLLHRVRQDLLRAGLDVDRVIERARGSGMIRAPIAVNAMVILA